MRYGRVLEYVDMIECQLTKSWFVSWRKYFENHFVIY